MTSQILASILAVLAGGLAMVILLRRPGIPTQEAAEVEHLQARIARITESEERYRALVEATTEIVVQRDALGRITFANAGFGRLVGAEAFTLVGSTVDAHCLEQGPVEERPDGVRRIERRLAPLNGPPRWFSFTEMPVTGSDGETQWLHAGSDITDRIESARSLDEALTRAEAANVAKSRFLATVSHEFRTPLNGILGMADLVLETGLDAEQRTYVEAVRTSGKALLSLIDGILDFSRIESGRLDLASEPFDLAALAEGVVELLAPRAQDKGIEIALDIARDVAPMVIGDADRVRQILVNLAGNAVKFTQTGGVGIEILRDDDHIALTVHDTGPGILPERIPLLFEEFEQGDGSASRRHEGTGLGLAITRRLVARMGGRIVAESEPGRGSRFTALLPLSAEPGMPIAAPRSLDGRKVLIVAASPFQAPFLARRLSHAGADATLVATEAAGLDALSQNGFDAIIADRSLGDAAVRTLAQTARVRGVRCSLVLLSPFDRHEFGSPGAAGFDSYLIKPVRARSLFDRLMAPENPIRGAAAPAAPSPPRTTASGPRVLLAEDNPINALLATKALERLGATVVPARDGLEAVAVFSEGGTFDLALIDIRMPGLDGLETARRIRTLEAARGSAPLHLVALTANAGRDDECAAHAAGFDDFLPKPLNLRALPALLDRRSTAA